MTHPDFEQLKEKLKSMTVPLSEAIETFQWETSDENRSDLIAGHQKPMTDEEKKAIEDMGLDFALLEELDQEIAKKLRTQSENMQYHVRNAAIIDILILLHRIYKDTTPLPSIKINDKNVSTEIGRICSILTEDERREAITEAIDYIAREIRRKIDDTRNVKKMIIEEAMLYTQIYLYIRGELLRSAGLTP